MARVVDKYVNPLAFEGIERSNFEILESLPSEDIRPFIPLLVRASLVGDAVNKRENSKKLLGLLAPIEAANSIVGLLAVDFVLLEQDVKKELQLRQKLGNREQDSVLIQSLSNSVTVEFENGEPTRKFRLVLSEMLFIMSQMHESRTEYYMKVSDLFDSWVYLEEICDVLSVALVELPNLLNLCDVCEALLHVKFGPWIICRLVANLPDSFLEACFHLISNGDKCEEDTEGGIIRLDALRVLSNMNPKQSLTIRARCVEQCKMPALMVYLSLTTDDIENNFIPFLSGILLGNDQQSRMWFSAYIKNAQKRKADGTNSLTKMREVLWAYLRRIMQEAKENHTTLNDNVVVQASSLLRLCCALKGIAGFKLHDDEMIDLVELITVKAPDSPPGYRFVTLGLCTLLGCPTLLATSEQERKIVEWIKSLLRQESCHSSTIGVNSSFGEILLLMAIHFHSNQINAICDLVCQTLGMKIPIRSNTINKIRQMFVQEIFTEQVVTAHAVKVPVTPSLNGDLSGYLPVHCIYQLIKSRAFTKHKVPIKDWIYRQVMSTTFPIHPVLPPLLEVYAKSILVPGTGTTATGAKVVLELTNEPLTDEEVLGVFQNFQASNLVPQLLVLYYVLLYEDNRLSNCRNLLSMGKKVKIYSSKLFSQIPIKFLLQQAQKNQHECGGLFPSLLKLLTTHFPQLCILNEWLEESGMNSSKEFNLYESSKDFDEEGFKDGEITNAFKSCIESPVDAMKVLEKCKNITPQQLWPHAKEIIQQLPVIIRPEVPRKIQDLFQDVWYQLNNIFPRHLWEMTSNALLPQGSAYINVEELASDPIQLLRCEPQVYRCAPILNILLHILAAAIAGSKYFLSKHLVENPPSNFGTNGQNDAEREELKMALVAVQDSAAVQILLEACLPRPGEKGGIAGDLCLTEIQSVICSYLHQVFIADPNLAKLVHFQGYPLELLPMAVRGIPSMHICLDFIPELLNQPETEKQVFAIQLISHLCMYYAIPKSFSIAKLALNAMNAKTSGTVAEDRAEFFIPTLSALERFCEAFPPLINESVTLLMGLGKICTSQNSVERNRMCKVVRNKFLLRRVYETFDAIVKDSVLDTRIF